MSDHIELRGIRVSGIHGVLESEKLAPQEFEVDLIVATSMRRAGMTDALEDTVSYCEVLEVVRRVVEDESYDLMERMAARIAEEALHDERITSIDVRVRKLKPPVEVKLQSAGVHIVRP